MEQGKMWGFSTNSGRRENSIEQFEKKKKKNSRSKCNKLIFVGHKSLTPGEVCNLLRQYFSQLYTEQASEYSDAKHLSSTAKT